MNEDFLFAAQRSLRRTLFEGQESIRWPAARDLAAHLLLYLDDSFYCWQLITNWLREQLDADRVDGGFGGYAFSADSPSQYTPVAESQRGSLEMKSMLGLHLDARDPGIRLVWHRRAPTQFADIHQLHEMTPLLVKELMAAGTAAKIAIPLHDGARPVGLLCADWQKVHPKWDLEVCNQLGQLSASLFGPVLAISSRAKSYEFMQEKTLSVPGLELLTPSERRVAEFVAEGLSYKEMARQLDRSLATVDHHLRSIRRKMDVSSTAKLARLLTRKLPKIQQDPAY